jgi:DNA-binding NarL/FixJ family response regulator
MAIRGKFFMIRLFLFTDEPVLASGLKIVLSSGNEFELAGTCQRVSEIAAAAADCGAEILLIDLTAEVTFDILMGLQARFPAVRMVLWAHTIPTEMAFQAMEHGVRGILRKTLPSETLLTCLRIVSQGGLWFDEVLEAALRTVKRIDLAPRESQLVNLITSGFKNKEIATALFLSEGTVKVYLSKLFQKLGVKDRFELALYGLKNMAGSEVAGEGAQPQKTQSQRRNSECVPLIRVLAMHAQAPRASAMSGAT